MSFGKTIKKLRREREMTQEQLAEVLSISPQAISRWETDMENLAHNIFMDFYFVPMELINSLFPCKRSEHENGRNYLGKNGCISRARNSHFENYYKNKVKNYIYKR